MEAPVKQESAKAKFLGAKVFKEVEFVGNPLNIRKLTVKEVMQVQELAKALANDNSDEKNLELISYVITSGANDLHDVTKEEMLEFALDDLTALSNAIMEYSGLAPVKSAAETTE
jgi:hypothetical protein